MSVACSRQSGSKSTKALAPGIIRNPMIPGKSFDMDVKESGNHVKNWENPKKNVAQSTVVKGHEGHEGQGASSSMVLRAAR